MVIRNDPKQMQITDLARCCAQETENYFHNQIHDSSYCFEIFRRAVCEQDQVAWDLIYLQYNSLVAGWVKQNQRFETTGEEVQYFVNGAFGKMSNHLNTAKFSGFADLGFILRYLKMCVHSVIVDFDRSAHIDSLYSLDDAIEKESTDVPVEKQEMRRAYRQAFWDWINTRLHDEKERSVIYGSFVLDLKPQELYDHFRTKFTDMDEIYRIKQNVLARLRRDSEFLKLIEQYD